MSAELVNSPIPLYADDATASAARGGISDPSGKAGRISWEMEHRFITGEYQFGEVLSITKLARQFNASRQPVSAAIAHLRSSGYVEIIPQVGCRVVSPGSIEIGDFFGALGKLEGVAAALASRRHRDGEAEALVRVAEQATTGMLDEPADRIDYIDYIYEYHDQLWHMARSPVLSERVASMRRLASFYLWQGKKGLVPSSAQLLTQERQDIARAIAAGDSGRAELLMERHIAHKPHVNGILS